MKLNDIFPYIAEPIGCFMFASLPVILKKLDVPYFSSICPFISSC